MLEEEGHFGIFAPIPDLANPFRAQWTGMGTAFPTNDDPGNALQVKVAKGFQQGLQGEKTHRRRRHGKVANAGTHCAVLHGNATPDMGGAGRSPYLPLR